MGGVGEFEVVGYGPGSGPRGWDDPKTVVRDTMTSGDGVTVVSVVTRGGVVTEFLNPQVFLCSPFR